MKTLKRLIGTGTIYRRSTFYKLRVRDLMFSAAGLGFPLCPNDVKLRSFKDIHRGERCFVLGNGPSLSIADLDKLKGEYCFAANKIYLSFEQTAWRPSYYFVEDINVMEQNWDNIASLEGFPKFFPFQFSQLGISPIPKGIYYNFVWEDLWAREFDYPKPPPFSLEVCRGVQVGCTVIYGMLQFAAYMGFKEIYLLGIDFNFELPSKHASHGFGKNEGLISEGEINHFHPDYRKPGEVWTAPNLAYQQTAFEAARNTLNANNIQIKNATRGGKLEVFERVDFDSLFGKKKLAKLDPEFLWLEAGRTEKNYWGDLWRYRELFFTLAWRDIAVRYRQTFVGVAWAIIQPFVTMVIMTLLFSKLAGLPTRDGAPYALLVFAGLLPWQLFANSLSNASTSIVSSANLISKIYFPRLIVPISSIVVAFVDFLVAFLIMIGMMIWYEYWPTWRILTLPAFILLGFLAALGPGLILTALTVRFRDFRFIVPFILQIGLYVSPVGYSSDVIRDRFGDTAFMLYSLNPMVGVIKGFRWAILGGDARIYLPAFFVSVALVLILLVVGLWYFRKTEKAFADVI